MDWGLGVYRGEPRVEELHSKVVRLRQEVAAAEPVDTTAKTRVAAATDALSRAETKATEAENAVSEYIKSQASAFKEDARMAAKVDAATAEVDEARHRLQELNEQPTAQNAWDGSANAKALGALTDRDLNEVRKFSKPPHVVRRALELVQAMLAVADREASLIITGNGDVLEPEHGVVTIGSGGAYAQAAALALLNHTELSAQDIVRRSLEIAGELCIYTNMNHTIETLP